MKSSESVPSLSRRFDIEPLTAACRTQDDAAATVPENRNQNSPYFTAYSLNIPDMRGFIGMREIVKICPHSRRIQLEPVFRYRTPGLHVSRRIHFSGEMRLDRLDNRPQGHSRTIAQGRSFNQ
jgi:hypothetical protein